MNISRLKQIVPKEYIFGADYLMRSYHLQDARKTFYTDARNYEEDGKYYVYPFAIYGSSVYIVCPFCGRVHEHGRYGGALGASYEGMRLRHCSRSEIEKDLAEHYYIKALPKDL